MIEISTRYDPDGIGKITLNLLNLFIKLIKNRYLFFEQPCVCK